MMDLSEIKCGVCFHKVDWTLAREQAPWRDGPYLVTTKAGVVAVAQYFENNPYWEKHVEAWMPLPRPYVKPYRKGNDNGNANN